jgi:hypothetical protein
MGTAIRIACAALAAFLSIAPSAEAQCSGGRCLPMQSPFGWPQPVAAASAGRTVYEWRKLGDDDYRLFSGPYEQGGYVPSTGKYWPSAGNGRWAAQPGLCPTSLPTEATARPQATAAWQTGGVNAGEISHTERVTVTGLAPRSTTAAGSEIPDLSGKARITPIGSAEECAAVEQDWKSHPAFSGLKTSAILKSYRPSDPQVVDRGFVTSGHPTISVQAADGTELRRFESYPGAEALASYLASDLRKPNPNYNPAATPGPATSVAGISSEALIVLAIAAASGFVLYQRRASTSVDDLALEGVPA